MADDFGVRPSQIGLLITAFALGMIVGAPVMAIATLRLPKRATLVMALAVFAAGHIVAALSGLLRAAARRPGAHRRGHGRLLVRGFGRRHAGGRP